MSKDVILDRYARLYEMPFHLARNGWDVSAFCLSYRRQGRGEWVHEANPGTLVWRSENAYPGLPFYPWRVLRKLRDARPDVIIAASDIPHVVLGQWLASQLAVPFVSDLYDNFESFGQARLPGWVSLFRRAVRRADLVLTTSEPLRKLVREVYRPRGEVLAVPSTVDKARFRPLDRLASRTSLGLPLDAPIIGTAGGLTREKGIETLYAAWHVLKTAIPNLRLALAGPSESSFPPPDGDRVHYLGALPHDRIAEFFSALDVGAICIQDTPFGRYCFPQKAYEMLACGLPVVAANVGAMTDLFATTPECLYRSGHAAELADRIRGQLTSPRVPAVEIEDWEQVVGKLDSKIRFLVQRGRRGLGTN